MSYADILVGEAKHLPFTNGYFHCVVTSPPYWGLRDYGLGPDSLGLESTPELYVQHLIEIFREVRRTLRDDGTLWLILGDSYVGTLLPHGSVGNGLKPKDLVGIPWMVAFALRADGWYLRSDIIWHKPNPMPESVKDRPTKAHEYIFLLSKSKRYYYDKEAIAEPAKWERWGKQTPAKIYRGSTIKARSKEEILEKFGGKKRNARTVWNIPTQSYSGAHFAVFPEKLVKPCILAGTSEWGCCPECGAPWERLVERVTRLESGSGRSGRPPEGKHAGSVQAESGNYDIRMGPVIDSQTTGWRPTCDHDATPVPCRVLDPFAGSGTVGVVTQKLNRNAVLIDAKPEYAKLAVQRIFP